jgi:hypothetical protein
VKIARLVILSMSVVAFSLIVLSGFAISQTGVPFALPAGWRLPRPREVAQAWRSAAATHYLVALGNFSGKESRDTALLLVLVDGSGAAPFVAMTNGHGETSFVQVEQTIEKDFLETEGLKLAKPGTYRTACGKGYGDCGPGEKDSITIPFDAIEMFKYEGPSRLVYWDAAKKTFAEVWLSD